MDEANEVLIKVITKLAEDAGKFIVGKIKDYFVDREKKEQIDFEYAYKEYLKKVYDIYSKTKTVIYTNEDRDLKKFFVPSDLTFEKNMPKQGKISLKKSGSYTLSGKTITDVFEKSNKIIITGIGGLGKTMHMKHFCISAIENGFKIPVFISLRWLNDRDINEKPLENLIYEILEEFGFKLDYEYFLYSLESDRYVFLFDGYDEVSKAKMYRVSNVIQIFSHRYSNNSFIISTRQIDSIYGWDEYIVYSLCPLELKDAVQLIWKLDFAEDMKKGFIDALCGGIFDKYYSLASVPLLLSIMYFTYVEKTVIPESLIELYDMAFETMLYVHDRRQKPGFERELKSGLSYTDFKIVFTSFSFKSYFNDEYSFSETRLIDNIDEVKGVIKDTLDAYDYKDDLVDVACMLIRDGLEYTFIHRSFQEFFAARYVSKMFENEEREFCLDYIDSFDVETINLADSYIDIGSERNKAIDFLSILYQIDKKKFEQIVLKPIIRKIYETYENFSMDLIKTIQYYCFVTANEYSDKVQNNSLVFCIYDVDDGCLTEREFNVLYYFFRNVFSKEYGFEAFEVKNISYYEARVNELIEYNYYDDQWGDSEYYCFKVAEISSFPGDSCPKEIAIDLLSLFAFSVEKYNSLNQMNKGSGGYMDRVNNPKYYTH